MIKKVLIVDDNQEMLLSLKEGLEQYDESFSILLAKDGISAVNTLKRETISMVVTDLKMPRMDGFALLAHIMERYPDIPVIIMTGFSTPEMERLANMGGAVAYIEKPFLVAKLAHRIAATLREESDGGTLHNVSSTMFLQLIEVEQKTCTIRLECGQTGQQGVLFFNSGDLFDARTNGLKGEAAAYEIFSWDDVSLSIQNSCPVAENHIEKDLQKILLEAMHKKDESTHPELAQAEQEELVFTDTQEELVFSDTEKSDLEEPEPQILDQPVSTAAEPDQIHSIEERLLEIIGNRSGLEKIYRDNSWQNLLARFNELGALFECGPLKLAYVSNGEASDFLLKPNDEVIVLSVNPKCPRDRIMQLLVE